MLKLSFILDQFFVHFLFLFKTLLKVFCVFFPSSGGDVFGRIPMEFFSKTSTAVWAFFSLEGFSIRPQKRSCRRDVKKKLVPSKVGTPEATREVAMKRFVLLLRSAPQYFEIFRAEVPVDLVRWRCLPEDARRCFVFEAG